MKKEQGYITLIEMMVISLIIAILIAIAIPTYLGAQHKAECRQDPTSHEDCPRGKAPSNPDDRYERREFQGFDCLYDNVDRKVVTCTTPTTSSLLR